MPWRTWFSAVCKISRLKCSAAWESSSSFSAALAETVRLRSSSDITRREEAAPIEEAIRRSACCSNSKSAGAAGSRLPGWPAAKASKAWRGALGAEILRHRALDVLHGNGGPPAPERRRDRRQRVGHEQIRLQPFDRRRPLRDRHHDVGQDVERERPEHAMHQRRQIGAEQCPRTQRLDAERSVLQQQQAGGIALQEARQEQRIGPHRKADQHAGHGAARGSLAPEQAAEEGRRQLGKRCERQQADRRQLRVAERAIVEIRHHHDGEDRKAPDPEQEVAEILAGRRASRGCAAAPAAGRCRWRP